MRNALITTAGTILVPSIIDFLIPYLILNTASETAVPQIGLLEIGAIILAVIGICMVVWVSITFVSRGKGTPVPFIPPTEFIAGGLFRWVRNPMSVGLLLVIMAEAVFFPSVWLLLYAFLLWLLAHTFIVLLEEPQLEKRFGDAYQNYKSTTPRWIPRSPHPHGT